jgi:hypothetical protein
MSLDSVALQHLVEPVNILYVEANVSAAIIPCSQPLLRPPARRVLHQFQARRASSGREENRSLRCSRASGYQITDGALEGKVPVG